VDRYLWLMDLFPSMIVRGLRHIGDLCVCTTIPSRVLSYQCREGREKKRKVFFGSALSSRGLREILSMSTRFRRIWFSNMPSAIQSSSSQDIYNVTQKSERAY
jgi:hypothetical protein